MREPRDAAEEMAIKTVREVQALLQTDEQWTQWTDSGFNWWPQWFEQRVWFEHSRVSRGDKVARVVVETPIAVTPSASLPDALVDLMYNSPGTGDRAAGTGSWHPFAIVPALSALVQRDGSLLLRSSIVVHEETEDWLRKVIGYAAAEQVNAAFRAAVTVQNGFRLALAKSAHPKSGPRTDPDGMVAVVAGGPTGKAPNSSVAWVDSAEFESTAAQLTEAGFVSTTDGGTGTTRGLTFEIPTGPDPGFALQGKTSSLVQVDTDVLHPRLGSGLFIRLRPYAPRIADSPAAHLSALEANLAETGVSVDNLLLGSWVGSRGAGLSYVSFLPDALYRLGGMAIMCWTNATRADWFERTYQVPPSKAKA